MQLHFLLVSPELNSTISVSLILGCSHNKDRSLGSQSLKCLAIVDDGNQIQNTLK
jgi:hypothetical protein